MENNNVLEHIKELDKLANSNHEITVDIGLVDYAYCIRARELYRAYGDGRLYLDDCKNAKAKLMGEYKHLAGIIDSSIKVYAEYQANINKVSTLKTKVTKSNEPMEMLVDCLEAVSLLTGEMVFKEVNVKKLQERGVLSD